jgi:hypothetical protein
MGTSVQIRPPLGCSEGGRADCTLRKGWRSLAARGCPRLCMGVHAWECTYGSARMEIGNADVEVTPQKGSEAAL